MYFAGPQFPYFLNVILTRVGWAVERGEGWPSPKALLTSAAQVSAR